MLPGVDEEAIQAAEDREQNGRGEENGPECWQAGDGGDEDGGGEEDADGKLLGKTPGVGGGVNEDEVSEEHRAEDEVEAERRCGEMREQRGEKQRGEDDADDKGAAVEPMEVVAFFEFVFRLDGTGVEKAIGGIEHPDGDGHGEDGRGRQPDVVGAGDEPCPEGGDGGCVEREEVPQDDGIAARGRAGLRGRFREMSGCRHKNYSMRLSRSDSVVECETD
jgi:hypothetical protein